MSIGEVLRTVCVCVCDTEFLDGHLNIPTASRNFNYENINV